MEITQAEMTKAMVDMGAARADSKFESAKARGRITQSDVGSYLLDESVAVLSREIEAYFKKKKKAQPYKKNRDYFYSVGIDTCAFLACIEVIDNLALRRPYRQTCVAIGREIEDEARYRHTRKHHKDIWDRVLSDTKYLGPAKRRQALTDAAIKTSEDWEPWSRRTKFEIGVVLVELMALSTDLIKTISVPEMKYGQKKKLQMLIVPTQIALDWLEMSHEANRYQTPIYLPMVEPPLDWTNLYDGGYGVATFKGPAMVNARRSAHPLMTKRHMPQVYDAVNRVQRVAWRVNPNVFEVFRTLWTETDGGMAGLPYRVAEELPPKPENIEEDETARREWRRAAKKVYTRNNRAGAKRLRTSRIFHIANKLAHCSNIYFPYKCDFRGRIYPIPNFLEPQGCDLSKGLLTFSEAKPIDTPEAREWLAIHVANCFGIDKVTFEERVAWVEQHEHLIRNCAEDPLNLTWWQEADEPWQFLAAIIDWNDLRVAEEEGKVHESSLPCGMDGSNNGLQLYSLLIRDPEGARATNVAPSDTPQDIYMDVARAATEVLKKHHAGDGTEDQVFYAREWVTFFGDTEIPRSMVKRPVMIVPYSGTKQGCHRYIVEWYREQCIDNPGIHNFESPGKVARYMTDILWAAIDSKITGARGVMNWLVDVATTVSQENRPLTWTSPTGFPVHQVQYKTTNKEIVTTIHGKRIKRLFAVDDGKTVNTRKACNGIAPNLVHCLDAAVMTSTVNRFIGSEQGTHISVVHDCYATHAADAALLARFIREEVLRIFSQDLLRKFADEVLRGSRCNADQLNTTYPTYGSLDPEVVLESKYFFA